MSNCYICNHELTDAGDATGFGKKHYEHIIHNAIGGKLTSNEILCEKCGNAYSADDAKFAEIFTPFIQLFSQGNQLRAFDRNTGGKISKGDWTKGSLLGENCPKKIEVGFKNGKVFPLRPFYFMDDSHSYLTICAEENIIENYLKKVEKEVNESGTAFNSLDVVKITDFFKIGLPNLYFSKGMSDFNQRMNRGIVKIATEFALERGIEREKLDAVIKVDANSGVAEMDYDNAKIVPFIPFNIIETVYENDREKFEKSYPSHSLKLFSSKYNDGSKRLLCYVDLFSTFQYYVVLSENYEGEEISESYMQKLLKDDSGNIDAIDSMSVSDLDIVIRENRIDKESLNGKNDIEVRKFIKEVLRKKSCVRNLEEEIGLAYCNVSENIMMDILSKSVAGMSPLSNGLSESSKRIVSSCMKSEMFSPKDVGNIAENSSKYYRKYNFISDNDGIINESYPDKCFELFDNHKEIVQKYTTSKFSKLCTKAYAAIGVILPEEVSDAE